MIAPLAKSSSNEVVLFENSGIQFVDYEFEKDWNDNFDIDVKRLKTGKFMPYSKAPSEHLVRLFVKENLKGLVNPEDKENLVYDLDQEFEICESTEKSLRLYNGVWFPVPFYRVGSKVCEPLNWVRCRIVQIPAQREGSTRYHVTFAYDTSTVPDNKSFLAPTQNDVSSDVKFELAGGLETTQFLDSQPIKKKWVSEWVTSIFSTFAPLTNSTYKDEDNFKEALQEHRDEAHYLNVLAVLQQIVKPYRIDLKSKSSESSSKIDVCLVLDVGNSRSIAFLVEDDGNDHPNENFDGNTFQLSFRDLNTPECVYTDTFESRVEFQEANFDFANLSSHSGRTDAFVWHSLVRVGTEARNLAAHRSGHQGETGMTSPKRYLWKMQPQTSEWNYNSYRYQVPLIDRNGEFIGNYRPKFEDNRQVCAQNVFGNLINSCGDALFAGPDDQDLSPFFSYKSSMTFMLVEIFMHAIVQMNSVSHRNQTENVLLPRILKSIVLTTPPSISDQEREIYRFCAYEALGLIWKSMGYDRSCSDPSVYPYNFPIFDKIDKTEPNEAEMCPQVPTVIMKWDEALASQFVYLYNEISKVFTGNSKDFISSIRRRDADGRFAEKKYFSDLSNRNNKSELISARIASLDIGGGTTDLVITDYSFRKDVTNQNGLMNTHVVIREGFRLAGDDILLDIIRKHIIQPIYNYVLNEVRTRNMPSDAIGGLFLDIFGSSKTNVEERLLRCQNTQQIWMSLGLNILHHLENLEHLPKGTTDVHLIGTIGEFLRGEEQVTAKELHHLKRKPSQMPGDDIIENINSKLRTIINDFDLIKFKLDIDLMQLNRSFITGENNNFIKPLASLAAVISVYRCDILLLSGRPSKIPGIRTYLHSKLALSPKRIVPLHSYKCGSWYPVKCFNGKIGDPKTTVVVGAVLGYKRLSSRNLHSFRIDSKPGSTPSQIRFLGGIDEKSVMMNNEILYRLECPAEDITTLPPSDDKLTLYSPENTSKFAMQVVNKDPSMSKTDTSKVGFSTTLSKTIGYRQFDNEYYPANYLYSIEPCNNINMLPKMRALNKSNFSLPKDSGIDACIAKTKAHFANISTQLQSKTSEVLSIFDEIKSCQNSVELDEDVADDLTLTTEFQNFRNEKLQEASDQAELDAQNFAESRSSNVGMFGRMFGGAKKIEEEKKNYHEAQLRKYRIRAEELLRQKLSQMRQQQINDKANRQSEKEKAISDKYARADALIRKILLDNIKIVKDRAQKDLKKVKEYADNSFKFQIKLKVHSYSDVSDNGPQGGFCPYGNLPAREVPSFGTIRNLYEVLKDARVLHNINYIEFDTENPFSVVTDNGIVDISPHTLVLRLKTSDGSSDYWTDSGVLIVDVNELSKD